MPSVSEKQRRAMQAAAHGHSTLGIPKSVGKDFVAADASATTNGRKPADGKVDERGRRIMKKPKLTRYLDNEKD